MNNNNQEIEIKIKVTDREALVKNLLALGAKKNEGILSRDVMYDDGKGFFDADKVLRLRSYENGKFKLTYKEPLNHKEHDHLLERVEIETKLEDGKNMELILNKLGFVPYRIKEKVSEHYEVAGLDVELHQVPFMGDYMEIEAEEMVLKEFLPKIGFTLSDGINIDYTALFMGYCAEHSLSENTPQTFDEEKKHLQK